MIIDLKSFKQKGIFYGDFEFSETIDNDVLSLPNATFADKVFISGKFDIGENNKVYVSGKVSFAIQGECSRCLSPVKADVAIDFDEVFSLYKSDEDCYSYSKDRIDLAEMVKELILLESPKVIYCKDDCKGLCPTCGKNLNNGECDCGDNL